MGITAYFYQHNKKVNSTKLPTTSVPGDFAVTIELKDVTNIYNPTLIISARWTNGANLGNPAAFNYCYIPDFSRYYFIKQWTWINGRWQCDCEVDVLASFKTEIGNTTAYILRSASNYDSRIIDSKYPTKSDCKTLTDSHGSIWYTNLANTSVNSGFFVLGIVNNDTGSIGATSYYAVCGRGLRNFMSDLYASPAWMNITDASISNDLQKMLINPIQYIVSCMWIPCYLDTTGLTQVGTIPVGWWNITLSGNDNFYKLTGSALKLSITSPTFDVPVHPQTSDTHLTWLKNAPYSVYQVQFYPFGVFPIDSAKLYGYNKLNCHVDVDLVTGIGTLTVTRGINLTDYSTDILFSSNAQVGIPIPLAQMSVDMSRIGNGTTWALSAGLAIASDTGAVSELANNFTQTVQDAVPVVKETLMQKVANSKWLTPFVGTGLSTLVNGNQSQQRTETNIDTSALSQSATSLLSSVAKVASNIGNAVLASSGTCQTTGATGALAQFTLNQILVLFYYDIVDQNGTFYGYPLCQNKKISTLSGFTLCATEGDLSIPGTANERLAVIALMKAGFFYE